MLFVACTNEDYLADSVFHGLRSLLGDRVVDHPRVDPMYASITPSMRKQLYGRGFTLYGTLPDIEIDRHRLDIQVADGAFDVVVFSNIHNTYGRFVEMLPHLRKATVAVLDGCDSPALYPYSGTYWRHPSRWFLPRAHTRFHYFKREWTPDTLHYRYFLACPPALRRHLPTPRNLHPVSFAIPAAKVLASDDGDANKHKLLPSHIVDDEVRARVNSGSSSYAFEEEEDYYRDIRASRFGITTKRAGWDCLRHYEIAANGTVPCFRDLESKPDTCAPHGLSDENCVSYTSADQLLSRLEGMSDDEYRRLRRGALAWARANTTIVRARELLATIGITGYTETKL